MQINLKLLGILILLGACLGGYLNQHTSGLTNQETNQIAPRGLVLIGEKRKADDTSSDEDNDQPSKRLKEDEEEIQPYIYNPEDQVIIKFSGRSEKGEFQPLIGCERTFTCPQGWTPQQGGIGGPGKAQDIDPTQNFFRKHFCWWCQNEKDAILLSRRRMLQPNADTPKNMAKHNTVILFETITGAKLDWEDMNWNVYVDPVTREPSCTHTEYLKVVNCVVDKENHWRVMEPQPQDQCWNIGYCRTYHTPEYSHGDNHGMGHLSPYAHCLEEIDPEELNEDGELEYNKEDVMKFDNKSYIASKQIIY